MMFRSRLSRSSLAVDDTQHTNKNTHFRKRAGKHRTRKAEGERGKKKGEGGDQAEEPGLERALAFAFRLLMSGRGRGRNRENEGGQGQRSGQGPGDAEEEWPRRNPVRWRR